VPAPTRLSTVHRPSLEVLAEELVILYQDDDLVVVNKPSGLLVHRGWANDKITAVHLVREHTKKKVHPVHRLDRPTSGALLFACSESANKALNTAFREGRIEKRYLALVRGITPEQGAIDNPVPSRPKGPRVEAQSAYWRRSTFDRYSLVEVAPRTGRLHQVRRHLKHITHPIIGDVNYGKGDQNRLFREKFGLHRMALHAGLLSFPHPGTSELLTICAPLPNDLTAPFLQMGLAEPSWQMEDSLVVRPVMGSVS